MTLPQNWQLAAAAAYLATLDARGMALEIQGGHLLIPEGETPAEVELVRLLKPELMLLAATGINGA